MKMGCSLKKAASGLSIKRKTLRHHKWKSKGGFSLGRKSPVLSKEFELNFYPSSNYEMSIIWLDIRCASSGISFCNINGH